MVQIKVQIAGNIMDMAGYAAHCVTMHLLFLATLRRYSNLFTMLILDIVQLLINLHVSRMEGVPVRMQIKYFYSQSIHISMLSAFSSLVCSTDENCFNVKTKPINLAALGKQNHL